MSSNFPSGPDTIVNNVVNSTPQTDTHPDVHNQLADAVMAVETELLPGGSMNLAAHVGASDPHPVYLTQAEGNALYAPIGGGGGGGAPSGPAGGALAGTYPNPTLAPNSVATGNIVDGTIAAGDLAAGAAASNVGTLGGALTGTLPNPGLAALPANSVTSAQIVDGTIATADLADGAVTSQKIADGTVVAGDIADGTITSAKIQDGTLVAADHADASLTNAKLGPDVARANLLTNGGFEIWQRGNGPFTANTYTADRWFAAGGGPPITVTREATVVDGAGNSLKAISTGAATAVQGRVENTNGLLSGRTVALSMRVNANVANSVRLALFGATTAAVYGAYHPGDGTWHTLTVVATVAAGETNLNAQASLDLPVTAYLDNACLVVGSQPADYVPLHPADDLARCLRYYEIIAPVPGSFGLSVYGAAGGALQWEIPLKATKAVAPTVTKTGTWTVANTAQPTVPVASVADVMIQLVATAQGQTSTTNGSDGKITVEANP